LGAIFNEDTTTSPNQQISQNGEDDQGRRPPRGGLTEGKEVNRFRIRGGMEVEWGVDGRESNADDDGNRVAEDYWHFD
jgi:hypothetical protein